MTDTCIAQGGTNRAALHAALDRVLDVAPGTVDGPELRAALDAVHELTTAVDGRLVGLIAGFEASGQWALEGHSSPVSWLVAEHAMARRAAGGLRRTCLTAAAMPGVSAAARVGVLPMSHLHLLARARRQPVEDLFDRDEAQLVADARQLTADGLRMRLERWYYDALAELGLNEPDVDPGGTDGNALRLRPSFLGSAVIDGQLSNEGYATIAGAIDTEIARLRTEGGLEDDPRSYAELAGDALVNLVNRGARRQPGSEARPSMIVVVDLDTFLGRAAVPETDRTERRAEILGAGPVADATVRELAVRARVSLLITDRNSGQPLWHGRERRLATQAQRNAVLAASDGTCCWPGCAVPAWRCEIDHLHGWEQGGPTDIDNLAPCCGHHNRLKYRGRYRSTRLPDGTITITAPSGQPVTTRYRHTA